VCGRAGAFLIEAFQSFFENRFENGKKYFDNQRLFISPKLDHPFRSKLNHPEQLVKARVKIGLRYG
jgi:hypothetical protein